MGLRRDDGWPRGACLRSTGMAKVQQSEMDVGPAMYATVSDAARGVLVDACSIAEGLDIAFAVIGGWSPLLLNSDRIPHPGTRDVDMLFPAATTPEGLKGVVEAFLDRDYLPSIKHPFQLVRVLNVGGRRAVMGIDLLHPREEELADVSPEMFVDHVDLDVRLGPGSDESLMIRSIVTPHAGFIMDDEEYEPVNVQARTPDGRDVTVAVPVINELALIITKSNSFRNPKRRRDSFDIYLAASQARDHDALRQGLATLADKRPEVFAQLGAIREALEGNAFDFNDRVGEFMPSQELAEADPDYARSVLALLDDVEGSEGR